MVALMVALFAFIGSLIAKLIEFFVKKIGWKALVYGLYVVSTVALVLGFYAAINLILGTVSTSLPSNITGIMTDFLPSNTPAVLAAVFAIETLAIGLNYKARFLKARTVGSPV